MKEDKTCKNCRYFYYTTKPNSNQDGLELDKSECRRYAPRVIHGSGTGWANDLFANVSPDDWCGEIKPKELKTAEVKESAAGTDNKNVD